MTTGTIMLYTGAAMIGVAAILGLPVLFLLKSMNEKIRKQIYSDFH